MNKLAYTQGMLQALQQFGITKLAAPPITALVRAGAGAAKTVAKAAPKRWRAALQPQLKSLVTPKQQVLEAAKTVKSKALPAGKGRTVETIKKKPAEKAAPKKEKGKAPKLQEAPPTKDGVRVMRREGAPGAAAPAPTQAKPINSLKRELGRKPVEEFQPGMSRPTDAPGDIIRYQGPGGERVKDYLARQPGGAPAAPQVVPGGAIPTPAAAPGAAPAAAPGAAPVDGALPTGVQNAWDWVKKHKMGVGVGTGAGVVGLSALGSGAPPPVQPVGMYPGYPV